MNAPGIERQHEKLGPINHRGEPEPSPPVEDRSARLRIIAAAEEFFAEYGFDGTSLRQVAVRAGVPPGLIGYHFDGKLGLYRAIFELRMPAMVEQRVAGLALADLEDERPRHLELIVKAMLMPMLRLTAQEGGGHFGVLLAREVSDPRSIERGIVEKMLDPIATMAMDQLRRVLPDRSEAEINWSYNIIVGTMVYAMADAGRIARLSKGAADPKRVDETVRHLAALLVNGLLGSGLGGSSVRTPEAGRGS